MASRKREPPAHDVLPTVDLEVAGQPEPETADWSQVLIAVSYEIPLLTARGLTPVRRAEQVSVVGELVSWELGEFPTRSGRRVYGVKLALRRPRRGYVRAAFRVAHAESPYDVRAHTIRPTVHRSSHVVPLPREATNVEVVTQPAPGPRVGVTDCEGSDGWSKPSPFAASDVRRQSGPAA